MKPDLLICWTKHCDYPIFRATLMKYRDWFGKVIIYFSEHNRFPYYDHFIQDSLKEYSNYYHQYSFHNTLFLDPTFTDWSIEDWRNHATNEMLKHSDSEWVCSIEQDWFSKDWKKLFTVMEDAMKHDDLIGWMNYTNNPYIHPAFWFIKRELLEKTQKDFTPHLEINGADHFAMITYDAQRLGAKVVGIQDLGFETNIVSPEKTDCFHLGGVNTNYLNFNDLFKTNNIHRTELFYVYNYWSMRLPVLQSLHFQSTMEHVDTMLESMFGEKINPETSEWSKFFKL